MDRPELCQSFPREGKATGPEGTSPQHCGTAQVWRNSLRVLVTAGRKSKVSQFFFRATFDTDEIIYPSFVLVMTDHKIFQRSSNVFGLRSKYSS